MPTAVNQWCCTASIIQQHNDNDDKVQIEHVAGYTDCKQQHRVEGSYDLTISSQWMEYIEQIENRIHEEGGAGAYDVFRCDLYYSSTKMDHEKKPPKWRIWGQEFHLDRLLNSYRSLMEHRNERKSSSYDSTISQDTLNQAYAQTKSIIRELLKEAESSELFQSVDDNVQESNNDVIRQLKMSLLWSPPPSRTRSGGETANDASNSIVVRGHASSTCQPLRLHAKPKPILTTLAVSLHHHHDGNNPTQHTDDDDDLPTRARNPQSKIASWCRLRKPLENPQVYKPPGVGEVLMLKPALKGGGDLLQVLEGLTSNFFVVYKNGSLGTATQGVLHGYVRHLVLECASRMGINVNPKPILLHESDQWKEAFITSSSRLIYPISQILIPRDDCDMIMDDGDDDDCPVTDLHVHFDEVWSDPVLMTREKPNHASSSSSSPEETKPTWELLLEEILRLNGSNNNNTT